MQDESPEQSLQENVILAMTVTLAFFHCCLYWPSTFQCYYHRHLENVNTVLGKVRIEETGCDFVQLNSHYLPTPSLKEALWPVSEHQQ